METTLFERGFASVAQTRLECGSTCAIRNLLCDVAREHHGAAEFIPVDSSLLPSDRLPISPMMFVINYCNPRNAF